MEQWPTGWSNFWRRNLPNLTANIITPTNNQVFRQGETIEWFVHYESTLLGNLFYGWIEEIDIETDPLPGNLIIGINTLRSGYGTDRSVDIVINSKRTLGTTYNNFDDIIFKKGEQYEIPPDLLKCLIHQEALKKYDEQLGQYMFENQSYRYEAHKDYDWYSRQSPLVSPYSGWRGLANHPEHHFTIAGTVVTGESIPQGNQVPNDYCYWSNYTAAGKLKFPDNQCEGVIAAELVALNPNQKWPNRPNWNFTAQLVLASSYGLTQVLYETAVNRGFDTRLRAENDDGRTARPVEHLFDPEVNIDLGAKYLQEMYNAYGQNWFNALYQYNGAYNSPKDENGKKIYFDSVDYANAILRTWNNGNGIYKQINY